MSEDRARKGVSRRDFLKGTAIGAGAAALAGLRLRFDGGAPPHPGTEKMGL